MGYIIRNGIKYFGDNAVELTQAQYDALPASKLTDGVDYYITDAQAGAPLATEIAMSTSDNTSVADKLATIPTFTTHSDIITFSSAKTGYKDVAIPIGKIIPQGALLAADAGVPLVLTLQDLGNSTTRLRAISSTGTAYTSNVILSYLTIS